MKKIGFYLAAFFGGLSAGLLVMYKVIGDTVKVEVKKIKNKRVGTSTTTIPIIIDAKKVKEKIKQRKLNRKQKRELRKQK